MSRKVTIFVVMYWLFPVLGIGSFAWAMEPEQAHKAISQLIKGGRGEEAMVAIKALKKEKAKHPGLKYALYNLANDYENNGDDVRARELFKDVVAKYPGSEAAAGSALHLAKVDIRLLIEQKQFAEADAAVKAIRKQHADHWDYPWTVLAIAQRYQEFNKMDEARALWRELKDKSKDEGVVRTSQLLLAEDKVCQLLKAGDIAGAEAALTAMRKEAKGHEDMAWRLANIAGNFENAVHQNDRAEALFDEVVKTWPNNTVAPFCLCHSAKLKIWKLIDAGQLEAAEKAVDKLIADYSAKKDPLASWQGFECTLCVVAARMYEKGISQGVGNDNENAIPYFKLAAEMGEERALPLMNSGGWKDELFQYVANSWVELNLRGGGKTEDIEVLVDRSSKKNKSDTIAMAVMAKAYYDAGRIRHVPGDMPVESKPLYQKAIVYYQGVKASKDPHTVAKAYWGEADCYYRLGDIQSAIDAYQKIVEDYPDDEVAWTAQYLIGKYCNELGEKQMMEKSEARQKALAAYQRVLSNYPNCPWAENARGMVERLQEAIVTP